MTGRRAALWATLVPASVVAVGVVVKWVISPNAVRDVTRSGRALGVAIAVGVVWLALTWLLARSTRPLVRGTVMTVVSLALVVGLVLPSVRDTTVVEQRDDLAAARASGASVPETSTAPPATSGDEAAASSTTGPSSSTSTSTTTTVPAAPVQVSTGALVGIDHRAAGTANVFREPDGSYVVELLDIDIEPGPDYFVHVVPGADRREPGGGVDLGRLRGNVGTQYYDVPPGTAVEGEWTVLVWCRVFAVPVANATQGAV